MEEKKTNRQEKWKLHGFCRFFSKPSAWPWPREIIEQPTSPGAYLYVSASTSPEYNDEILFLSCRPSFHVRPHGIYEWCETTRYGPWAAAGSNASPLSNGASC